MRAVIVVFASIALVSNVAVAVFDPNPVWQAIGVVLALFSGVILVGELTE